MRWVKFFVVSFIVAIAYGALKLWWSTFYLGNYYANAAGVLVALGFLAPVFVVVTTFYASRWVIQYDGDLKALFGGMVCLVLGGCTYASANVQTLVTDDCGASWRVIPVGDTVPTTAGRACAYKVTIPDYPMTGETTFRTSFKDRVLANVEISYEYIIVDGKQFIAEAKYIGKADSDSDDKKNASTAYESAENTVIDKRLREVAATFLVEEDIVEFDQGSFEDKLLSQANEVLKDKGIRLNFLSFVPTPEEQTRLAIDMLTAMRVYDSKQLGELGKQLAIAKAGAARINNQIVKEPVSKPAE